MTKKKKIVSIGVAGIVAVSGIFALYTLSDNNVEEQKVEVVSEADTRMPEIDGLYKYTVKEGISDEIFEQDVRANLSAEDPDGGELELIFDYDKAILSQEGEHIVKASAKGSNGNQAIIELDVVVLSEQEFAEADFEIGSSREDEGNNKTTIEEIKERGIYVEQGEETVTNKYAEGNMLTGGPYSLIDIPDGAKLVEYSYRSSEYEYKQKLHGNAELFTVMRNDKDVEEKDLYFKLTDNYNNLAIGYYSFEDKDFRWQLSYPALSEEDKKILIEHLEKFKYQ